MWTGATQFRELWPTRILDQASGPSTLPPMCAQVRPAATALGSGPAPTPASEGCYHIMGRGRSSPGFGGGLVMSSNDTLLETWLACRTWLFISACPQRSLRRIYAHLNDITAWLCRAGPVQHDRADEHFLTFTLATGGPCPLPQEGVVFPWTPSSIWEAWTLVC